MSNPDQPVDVSISGRVTRREAMQWVMAAVAVSALPPTARRGNAFAEAAGAAPAAPPAKGYGLDPKLVTPHQPGAFWPLTFTDVQLASATALADVIIPKDDLGPAASAVGVPAMIDEWISAPYPQQQGDRPVILEGLAWLEAESQKRFSAPFAKLQTEQAHAICDDICFAPNAKPEFRKASDFFNRFRSLCASAYYATLAGWKAIGYVGNVALESFDGPPAEVLEKLGVTQTVV
ncbi:MAG TPA: gluconate 2-dehydrogenase subunit 3 family protein [Tepidisphaeraceae bacterium]|nr:gluconate 2-dehydrogenase subunit 3 family protein [Tepidisphaeraceae bacterium]